MKFVRTEGNMINKKKLKLTAVTFFSVIVMGFSLSLLNIVDLGTDPFTFMNLELSNALGIGFGNWEVILNVIMFVPVLFLGRKQMGIGTIFNMVLVGYSVEFFSWLWRHISFDTAIDTMTARLILMIPSLLIFVASAATYMSSDLGTAPYDALPLIISERLPKVPFRLIRFAWDAAAVVVGAAFGGRVRIVTVLMVLFIGQTVTFVKNKFFSNFK